MRRRIWAETVPLAELCAPALLRMLRLYDIGLIAAVRPGDLAGLPALLSACRAAPVPLTLWPMLDDAEGRWASAANVESFARLAREVCAHATRDGHGGMEIVVDLEPPIRTVAALFSDISRRGTRWTPRGLGVDLDATRSVLGTLADGLRGQGVRVSAAVVPLVLLDEVPPAPAGWQALLGTPVDGLHWDHASVLLYTSILQGWSRGGLRRADALALLADGCRLARSRFGDAAGVSLGAVGTGALGDEPVYDSVEALEQDVGVARACGIDDLALFELGGALARPPLEQWLQAFVATPPAHKLVRETLRARAALATARGIGRVAARAATRRGRPER